MPILSKYERAAILRLMLRDGTKTLDMLNIDEYNLLYHIYGEYIPSLVNIEPITIDDVKRKYNDQLR